MGKQLFCPIVWLHIHAVIAFFFSSLFLMYYKCENHFILFYYTHRGLTHALVQFRFFSFSVLIFLWHCCWCRFFFFLFLADFYFCSFNFFFYCYGLLLMSHNENDFSSSSEHIVQQWQKHTEVWLERSGLKHLTFFPFFFCIFRIVIFFLGFVTVNTVTLGLFKNLI